MSELKNIPKHWEIKRISDLIGRDGIFCDGDWIESKDQDSMGEIRLIQLADIGDGNFRNRSNRKLTLESAEKLGCTFLKKGDVLIARMPDPLGRSCIFPLDGENKFVTAVDVCIIRVSGTIINNLYLNYIINSPQSRTEISKLQSGSTRKRISRKNLNTIKLPVPPIPEQLTIVSKIEELLSDLENGKQQLQLAQQQLKVYRQSLLKWAFEGKLTNKNLKDGELPKGWKWTTLSELTEVKDGTHDTPKYIEKGIPFITQKNIRETGLSFSDIKYITQEDHDKFYKRSNVSLNDILISMIGANRGMTCLVNDARVFSIKNVGLIKSNPKNFIELYLLYFLKSIYAKNYVKSLSKGGAQEFIGLTELRKFPIVICCFSEQQLIIDELESKLTVCDKIEETINQSLQQAETLRQSILKKAFEGKLIQYSL